MSATAIKAASPDATLVIAFDQTKPLLKDGKGHYEKHMMEIKLGVPASNDIYTGLSNRFERM